MPAINNHAAQPAVFDPEAISVMGIAYANALASLLTSAPKSVCEVIAAKIIGAAREGERDPDKLLEMALKGVRTQWDQLSYRPAMPPSNSIETLACPECGAGMWLFGIEADRPGRELLSFDCPQCQCIETKMRKSNNFS
jgi:hypothetical protein